MNFAKRLKQAMAEKEVTQKELCELIGKGKSSVSQYLSGKNIPKEDVLEKIAEVLECTVAQLKEEEPLIITNTSGVSNVSVAEAARRLEKSEQFVRVALQNGRAPFGFAAKSQNSSKWSYHISPKKLSEYIGD